MPKIKLDELGEKLPQMINGAEELTQKKSVPIGELFTTDFMTQHTPFSSLDELLKAGGFHVGLAEEFKALLGPSLDKHISEVTKFSSWKEMLKAAGNQYAAKKMGL